MFVIHLEGYLADSIKRQFQYPVCHYSATTLVAVGQN